MFLLYMGNQGLPHIIIKASSSFGPWKGTLGCHSAQTSNDYFQSRASNQKIKRLLVLILTGKQKCDFLADLKRDFFSKLNSDFFNELKADPKCDSFTDTDHKGSGVYIIGFVMDVYGELFYAGRVKAVCDSFNEAESVSEGILGEEQYVESFEGVKCC